MKRLATAATLVVLATAAPVAAQHMDHAAHAAGGGAPKESGQAAFAAIGEIVSILRADPNTDWSKVDLERLRQHLIDMNAVTLEAEVETAALADGARFKVTGDGRAREAIKRMVPAHAATLGDTSISSVDPIPEGVLLTVRSADPRQAAVIKGLGFAGLMSDGAHHQPHHIAIARGLDPHTGGH